MNDKNLSFYISKYFQAAKPSSRPQNNDCPYQAFEIEASGKNTDIKIIYQFGEMKITSFVVPAKYISQGHTIHYASHWRLPSFQSWTEPLQGNEQLLEGLSKQPRAGHNLFLEKFLVWSSKSNRSVFVNLVLPWNHPDNRYLIFLFNSYHCSIVLPW